ncbi:site-specific DNA-methyltransferase [Kocuria palustris]|uniref:site-specific DNA-methyltransferase n=1 Tax=Kocuria palustris TaxID=71999 RepID=UPI0021A94BFA|nr:site-specific DNA-methyltransferase [Kocuria palustris]MCT1590769.1 site-specific DNA-methyltransferase [Kocuria palustris]
MSEEADETPSTTPNFQTELAAQLAELMPEVIADGKVDVEKLKELLDGDAADTSERFGLFWPGKKRALRAAQEPTTATLRPDFENSKDWDTTKNVFIEGDNLEVLKILQKHYHAKIKMIYIDPPYNTGGDFVYPDNYKEGLDTYLEWTRQVNDEGQKLSTNSDTQGRYHSNWLNMMYPRLKLARNLLTEDGVIFISIDDNEQPNLKAMCDEVFGASNFIAQIVRNTNSSKNQSLFVSVSHEYCLVYARNINVLNEKHATNKWSVPKNNVEEYKRRVKKLQKMGMSNDEITQELKQLTNYPRFIDFTNYWYFDDRGLYQKDNLGGVKNGNMTPIFNPITGTNDPIPPGGFRFNSDRLAEFVAQDRVHFHADGSLPRMKRYLDENEGQRPKSIMSDDQRPDYALLQSLGTPFDNPKQMAFMKRIISIADPDAMVLDFFAGSATTAHAVMELNAEDGGTRRFIQVQLPEPTPEGSEARASGFATISEISRARIDRAGDRITETMSDELALREEPLDVGFRTYHLADTNFSK